MSKAAWQWIALLLALAAGTALGMRLHARPLDAEWLHVHVAQLASFAAEARLLDVQRAAGAMPHAIAGRQAQQIANAFGKALRKLSDAQVEPALAGERRAAQASAQLALAQVRAMARERAASADLARAAQSLQSQSHRLEDAMP